MQGWIKSSLKGRGTAQRWWGDTRTSPSTTLSVVPLPLKRGRIYVGTDEPDVTR
jgi:hypothetical protein